jgi:hypothetical protein
LSNLRRPGALEDHPEWKAALEAVDAHWNPAWPPEWQRHYAALRELLADEDDRSEVLPGFTGGNGCSGVTTARGQHAGQPTLPRVSGFADRRRRHRPF